MPVYSHTASGEPDSADSGAAIARNPPVSADSGAAIARNPPVNADSLLQPGRNGTPDRWLGLLQ